MILLDTSKWIDLLQTQPKRLSLLPEDFQRFATCPPVLQELFQGLRDTPRTNEFRDIVLALPCYANPLPLELHLKAADLYRAARRRGLTIRSSTDCLIAAIAIEHKLTIWHKDRDFDLLAKFCELKIYT